MAQVGKVINLTGEAKVISNNVEKTLANEDIISLGDVIKTLGKNSSVDIQLENAKVIHLEGENLAKIDNSILTSESFEAEAAVDDKINDIINNITNNNNEIELDATAAGETNVGVGGSFSSVAIEQSGSESKVSANASTLSDFNLAKDNQFTNNTYTPDTSNLATADTTASAAPEVPDNGGENGTDKPIDPENPDNGGENGGDTDIPWTDLEPSKPIEKPDTNKLYAKVYDSYDNEVKDKISNDIFYTIKGGGATPNSVVIINLSKDGLENTNPHTVEVIADENGNYSYDFDLSNTDGSYNYSISNGNHIINGDFKVDNIAPSVSYSSIDTTDTTVTLVGKTEPFAKINIEGTDITVNADENGNFTITANHNGNSSVSVNVTDIAGNTSSQNLDIGFIPQPEFDSISFVSWGDSNYDINDIKDSQIGIINEQFHVTCKLNGFKGEAGYYRFNVKSDTIGTNEKMVYVDKDGNFTVSLHTFEHLDTFKDSSFTIELGGKEATLGVHNAYFDLVVDVVPRDFSDLISPIYKSKDFVIKGHNAEKNSEVKVNFVVYEMDGVTPTNKTFTVTCKTDEYGRFETTVSLPFSENVYTYVATDGVQTTEEKSFKVDNIAPEIKIEDLGANDSQYKIAISTDGSRVELWQGDKYITSLSKSDNGIYSFAQSGNGKGWYIKVFDDANNVSIVDIGKELEGLHNSDNDKFSDFIFEGGNNANDDLTAIKNSTTHDKTPTILLGKYPSSITVADLTTGKIFKVNVADPAFNLMLEKNANGEYIFNFKHHPLEYEHKYSISVAYPDGEIKYENIFIEKNSSIIYEGGDEVNSDISLISNSTTKDTTPTIVFDKEPLTLVVTNKDTGEVIFSIFKSHPAFDLMLEKNENGDRIFNFKHCPLTKDGNYNIDILYMDNTSYTESFKVVHNTAENPKDTTIIYEGEDNNNGANTTPIQDGKTTDITPTFIFDKEVNRIDIIDSKSGMPIFTTIDLPNFGKHLETTSDGKYVFNLRDAVLKDGHNYEIKVYYADGEKYSESFSIASKDTQAPEITIDKLNVDNGELSFRAHANEDVRAELWLDGNKISDLVRDGDYFGFKSSTASGYSVVFIDKAGNSTTINLDEELNSLKPDNTAIFYEGNDEANAKLTAVSDNTTSDRTPTMVFEKEPLKIKVIDTVTNKVIFEVDKINPALDIMLEKNSEGKTIFNFKHHPLAYGHSYKVEVLYSGESEARAHTINIENIDNSLNTGLEVTGIRAGGDLISETNSMLIELDCKANNYKGGFISLYVQYPDGHIDYVNSTAVINSDGYFRFPVSLSDLYGAPGNYGTIKTGEYKFALSYTSETRPDASEFKQSFVFNPNYEAKDSQADSNGFYNDGHVVKLDSLTQKEEGNLKVITLKGHNGNPGDFIWVRVEYPDGHRDSITDMIKYKHLTEADSNGNWEITLKLGLDGEHKIYLYNNNQTITNGNDYHVKLDLTNHDDIYNNADHQVKLDSVTEVGYENGYKILELKGHGGEINDLLYIFMEDKKHGLDTITDVLAKKNYTEANSDGVWSTTIKVPVGGEYKLYLVNNYEDLIPSKGPHVSIDTTIENNNGNYDFSNDGFVNLPSLDNTTNHQDNSHDNSSNNGIINIPSTETNVNSHNGMQEGYINIPSLNVSNTANEHSEININNLDVNAMIDVGIKNNLFNEVSKNLGIDTTQNINLTDDNKLLDISNKDHHDF